MSVLIAQSKHQGNEYYVFRPIGNDNYREIKFHIINNKIVENPKCRLNFIERLYIQDKFL